MECLRSDIILITLAKNASHFTMVDVIHLLEISTRILGNAKQVVNLFPKIFRDSVCMNLIRFIENPAPPTEVGLNTTIMIRKQTLVKCSGMVIVRQNHRTFLRLWKHVNGFVKGKGRIKSPDIAWINSTKDIEKLVMEANGWKNITLTILWDNADLSGMTDVFQNLKIFSLPESHANPSVKFPVSRALLQKLIFILKIFFKRFFMELFYD